MAENDADSAMTPLQSAACTYRIALGPRAGQKVLALQTVPSVDTQHTQQRCANEQGFSFHADVRCATNKKYKSPVLCNSKVLKDHGVVNHGSQRCEIEGLQPLKGLFADHCEEIWGVEQVADKGDYRFWN